MKSSLESLIRDLMKFRRERDWEQFHTPKNLAVSIAVEAGELLELFQWQKVNTKPSAKERKAIAREVADVLIYTLLLAHDLGIDPLLAASDKLRENAGKYPVEKSKGSARKYDELDR